MCSIFFFIQQNIVSTNMLKTNHQDILYIEIKYLIENKSYSEFWTLKEEILNCSQVPDVWFLPAVMYIYSTNHEYNFWPDKWILLKNITDVSNLLVPHVIFYQCQVVNWQIVRFINIRSKKIVLLNLFMQ